MSSPQLAAVLLCSLPLSAQLTVSTLAGGVIRSGVPAQNIPIDQASSLAIDPLGNPVFSTLNNAVIRRVNRDGTIETIAGTGRNGISGDAGPATQAEIVGARPIIYDAQGNLFFGDAGRIRKIARDGTIATIAGTGILGTLGSEGPATSAQVQGIQGMAVDARGNLYFTESNQNWIRRLTPDSKLEVFAGRDNAACARDGNGGPALSASICKPTALLLDAAGNLYFVESPYIRRISPDGIVSRFAGFGSLSPSAGDGGPALDAAFQAINTLSVDGSGNVYVDDGANGGGIIRRIAPDGTIRRIAGGGASSDDGPGLSTRFFFLRGMAAMSDGSVYFGDTDRLRVLTSQGNIQTIAGVSPQPAPDGIPARDAWLINPSAVAVSRSGNVYIAEGCTIRRIGSDGLLRLVAGTGKCGTAIPTGPAISADMPAIGGLAVDSQERIYYVYFGGGVGSIEPNGGLNPLASTLRFGSLAIDSKDRLYLYGPTTGLYRLVPGAPAITPLSWPGLIPPGSQITDNLAVDSSDNVYVVQVTRATTAAGIFRYNAAGEGGLLLETGLQLRSSTGQNAQSFLGFGVDPAGRTWVMTTISLGILQDGFLRPFDVGYAGDGKPASSARFGSPRAVLASAITVAPSGDVYIIDTANRAIRKIAASAPIKPVISQGGIVNALTLLGGPIAPGELISIFGSNFAGGLETFSLFNNTVPKSLGGVRAIIGGPSPSNGEVSGAVTAVSSGQVNVFVPYDLQGRRYIQIEVDGIRSDPFPSPLPRAHLAWQRPMPAALDREPFSTKTIRTTPCQTQRRKEA